MLAYDIIYHLEFRVSKIWNHAITWLGKMSENLCKVWLKNAKLENPALILVFVTIWQSFQFLQFWWHFLRMGLRKKNYQKILSAQKHSHFRKYARVKLKRTNPLFTSNCDQSLITVLRKWVCLRRSEEWGVRWREEDEADVSDNCHTEYSVQPHRTASQCHGVTVSQFHTVTLWQCDIVIV